MLKTPRQGLPVLAIAVRRVHCRIDSPQCGYREHPFRRAKSYIWPPPPPQCC